MGRLMTFLLALLIGDLTMCVKADSDGAGHRDGRSFIKNSDGVHELTAEIDGDGKGVLQGAARRKRALGQFFTEGSCWLQPQVVEFIKHSKCDVAYDPFAGSGCLFGPVTNAIPAIHRCEGLDIDSALGWRTNDSLARLSTFASKTPAVAGVLLVGLHYTAFRDAIREDSRQTTPSRGVTQRKKFAVEANVESRASKDSFCGQGDHCD